MTTAHRPTFHPAVGSAHQGGYRLYAGTRQYSSRDLPGQTQLKFRQIGQGSEEEMQLRDLKQELEDREHKHYASIKLSQERQGMLLESAPRPDGDQNAEAAALDLDFDDDDEDLAESDGESESEAEDEEVAGMDGDNRASPPSPATSPSPPSSCPSPEAGRRPGSSRRRSTSSTSRW